MSSVYQNKTTVANIQPQIFVYRKRIFYTIYGSFEIVFYVHKWTT